MQIQEIMTATPISCLASTPIKDVACLMALHDCGALPIVDDVGGRRPLGMITDRDIVLRALASGRGFDDLVASDCMTSPCVTVRIDASIADCCEAMEAHQIRRLVVTNADGDIVGIVSQADLARTAPDKVVGELLQELSLDQRPTF